MAEKKYIELEAAISSLDELEKTSHHNSVLWPDHVEECREALRSIPAADVRPVVKAHWIDIWSKLDPDTSFEVQCSKCRIISDRPAGNFCKWCGADMREES